MEWSAPASALTSRCLVAVPIPGARHLRIAITADDGVLSGSTVITVRVWPPAARSPASARRRHLCARRCTPIRPPEPAPPCRSFASNPDNSRFLRFDLSAGPPMPAGLAGIRATSKCQPTPCRLPMIAGMPLPSPGTRHRCPHPKSSTRCRGWGVWIPLLIWCGELSTDRLSLRLPGCGGNVLCQLEHKTATYARPWWWPRWQQRAPVNQHQ